MKCFVRDRKSITMLLRIDNTTAVAYVNKLVGTVSPKLNTIVRELWLWCMSPDILWLQSICRESSIRLRTKNPE